MFDLLPTSISPSSSAGQRGPWLVITPRTVWRARLERRRMDTSVIATQTVLTDDRPTQDWLVARSAWLGWLGRVHHHHTQSNASRAQSRVPGPVLPPGDSRH